MSEFLSAVGIGGLRDNSPAMPYPEPRYNLSYKYMYSYTADPSN